MVKTLDANVCLTHNNVCIDITINDNTIAMKVYEKDQYTLHTDTLDKEQEYYQSMLTKFGLSETDTKTISMFAIYNHEKTDDIRLDLPNSICTYDSYMKLSNNEKNAIQDHSAIILKVY